ncbi:hypothetical protein [Actinokineospora enzanensis]|uniref:hypothetical protein n=1 Tax=Actinokineospora enzanensis TaxID=155975 RepID=UPI00039FCC3A|nr:hypothetical protein [Actinokineospora enzanensis]
MRDFAERTLTIATRALPAHRRDWGAAMTAELAALTDPVDRRRFARGCARAVLFSGSMLRAVACHLGLLTFAAAAVVRATGLPSRGVQIEAIGLIAAIIGLARYGRRRSTLGPAGAGLARSSAYAMIMATAAVLLTTGVNDPEGWWLAAIALVVYLAGFLRVTARSTRNLISLPLIAILVPTALAVWWLPMLLSPAVRAAPPLTFLAAFALIPIGASLGSRLGSRTRGLLTGLTATAAVLLLMFLAAVLTYRLAPNLAPDLSAPIGMPQSIRAEQSRIEAVDPYVANYLIGAITTAFLIFFTHPHKHPHPHPHPKLNHPHPNHN